MRHDRARWFELRLERSLGCTNRKCHIPHASLDASGGRCAKR